MFIGKICYPLKLVPHDHLTKTVSMYTFARPSVCRNEGVVSFSLFNNIYAQRRHGEEEIQKGKRKGIGVLIFSQTQTSNSEEQTTYRITAAVSKNTAYRGTKRHKKAQNSRHCSLFLCYFRECWR